MRCGGSSEGWGRYQGQLELITTHKDALDALLSRCLAEPYFYFFLTQNGEFCFGNVVYLFSHTTHRFGSRNLLVKQRNDQH
jgi:hypothetical protein